MYSEVECSFEKRVRLCEPCKCIGLCIGYSVQCPGLCQVPMVQLILRKLVSVTVATKPSASCACNVPHVVGRSYRTRHSIARM